MHFLRVRYNVNRHVFIFQQNIGGTSKIIRQCIDRIRCINFYIQFVPEFFLHFFGYTYSLLAAYSTWIAAMKNQ